MEKETTVGKLTNCDTNVELSFSLAPLEFVVEESAELRIEPCLGRSHPVVNYHGGAARTLSTSLVFDKDADEKLDVQNVLKFLADTSKVNKDTKSIPLLRFKMGEFDFQGYMSRLITVHTRFATNGKANQLKVNFTLVAAGGNDDGN